MKLILHIGTHKTGTTALQKFLHANRAPLAARGLYYATPRGTPHSNLIADALNSGDAGPVREFLTKHSRLARRQQVDRILVSAENFYSMSVRASMAKMKVCASPVERDQRLIEILRTLIPERITACAIVCYVRRPDRYAESLYTQHVNRGIGFSGTFDEFLPTITPALSYNATIRSWSNVFGPENCVVRVYEAAEGDIVTDFARNVLGIADTAQFALSAHKENVRVARDLLEFTRQVNRRISRSSELQVERAILRVIDDTIDLRSGEPACYQEFLSPTRRAELLKRLQPELEALQASFSVPPFPRFDVDAAEAEWRPYPGLDEHRQRQIELYYDRVNRRLKVRFERSSARAAGFLRRRVPRAGIALDALKAMGAKRALLGFLGRLEGKGA